MSWTVEAVERGGVTAFRVIGPPDPAAEIWRDTPSRAVHAVEYLAVRAMLEGPDSPTSLHAALVSRDGKGVLLVGPAEAGKSTLATGLWQSGFDLLGDDVALLSPDDLMARSVPRRVSLRRPSRDLLGEALWARLEATPGYLQTSEGAVFRPEDIAAAPAHTRVSLIIFLRRRGAAADHEPQRLNPAEALMALLPYSNRAMTGDPGPAIRAFSTVCDRVPAFDLGRTALPQMIVAVERLLGP